MPGGPHCREALVAGRPSCREAPSLPGVNLSLRGSSCKAFHYCQGPDPRLLRGGPSQGKLFVESLLGSSRYEGPRCQGGTRCREAGGPRCRDALVAGRPSLPGGPRCREALVAGKPSLPGSPRCRRPSLPGGARCREALVAGRPSLPVVAGPSLPGGPRPCRKPLGAGRPSLPAVLVAGRPSLGKHLWGVPQVSQFWVDFLGNYDKDWRFFVVLEISKF